MNQEPADRQPEGWAEPGVGSRVTTISVMPAGIWSELIWTFSPLCATSDPASCGPCLVIHQSL